MLIGWHNGWKERVCWGEEPVKDERTDAAGVLPEALEFGLQHHFEFGQGVEDPVTEAILDLIPESLNGV